jgi:prenyltransferase beta subunit
LQAPALLSLAILLALPPGGPVALDEGDAALKRTPKSSSETPAVLMARAQSIVDRGLSYLANQQKFDGSFDSSDLAMHQVPVAVTALAALAFMARGNTAEHGQYAIHVDRSIKWLLDHCALSGEGDKEEGEFRAESDAMSRMHGQGYAVLALAQAYGMFAIGGDPAPVRDRERMKRCLEAAIRYCEAAQTQSGGWGYDRQTAMHEGSVTVTQLQGLRAARDAGLHVNTKIIDMAVEYVRRCQKLDDNGHPEFGGFRYMLNNPKITLALTAAAVSTLNATGDYDSNAIEKGIEYMQRKDPDMLGRSDEMYREYLYFYAGQALYQYRDPNMFWNRWYPNLIDVLGKLQLEDGSFREPMFGSAYATAMNCLTLSIPFGYLPIFQR